MSLSTPGSNQDTTLIQQQVFNSTPIPNPIDRNGAENKQVTQVKNGNQPQLEADASRTPQVKTPGSAGTSRTDKAEAKQKTKQTQQKTETKKSEGAAAAAAAAQTHTVQQTTLTKIQTDLKTDALEKAPSANMQAINQLVATAVQHGFPSASIETPSLTKPKVTPRSIVQEIAAAFANSLSSLNASTIESLLNFQSVQAQAGISNLAALQKENEATQVQRKELQERKDISNTKATKSKMSAGEIAAIAIGVTLAVVAIVVAVFTCGAGLALEGAAAAAVAGATAEGAVEGAATGAAVGAAAAEGAAGAAAGTAAAEGATEGAVEGAAEGAVEGAAEGIESTVETVAEGATEGATEGTAQGASEGAAEVASDIAENAEEEGQAVSQATRQVTEEAEQQATSSATKTTKLIQEGAAQTAEDTSQASESVGQTASTVGSTSSENVASSAEEAATTGIEESSEETTQATTEESSSQATSKTSSAIRNGLNKIKEIKNNFSKTYNLGKEFTHTKAPNLMKVLDTMGNKWMSMITSVVLALPQLAGGIEDLKLSKEQTKLAGLQKLEGKISAEAEQDTMFTSFWQQASRIASKDTGNTSQMEQDAVKTFSKLAKAYRSIAQGLSNSV